MFFFPTFLVVASSSFSSAHGCVHVLPLAPPVVEEGDAFAGVAQLAGSLQHLALVRVLKKIK